jgi:hypothetical protein
MGTKWEQNLAKANSIFYILIILQLKQEAIDNKLLKHEAIKIIPAESLHRNSAGFF